MAITQNTYTGNGSTVLFSFTFPYLETTDIKVSVNGTVTTAYTLANATTIQFNTAPVNGAAIRIYRQTDDSATAATFYPGSAIRSQDLNDNFTQNLYVTQEVNNNAVDIDGSNPMVGDLNMGGYKITNLATPVSGTDAANRSFVEGVFSSEVPVFYRRWSKTAAGGATSLSGNDDNGIALSYVPGSEKVFINGALQVRGVDYLGTTGSTLTGIPALTAGDIVEVHSSSSYTVGTVPDGSITNAKVDGGAAIQSTKLAFGSGATTRTVAAKLADVVSVKDFGAVGDGERDDTAALIAAAAALQNGQQLDFGGGTYLISYQGTAYSSIYGNVVMDFLSKSDIALVGTGATIKVVNHNITTKGGLRFANFKGCKRVRIAGLNFDMTFTGVNTSASYYPFCGAITALDDDAATPSFNTLNSDFLIERCAFKLFHPWGNWALSGAPYSGDPNNGFKVFSIFVSGPSTPSQDQYLCRNITVENCTWQDGHNGYGIWLWAWNNCKVSGCIAENWSTKYSNSSGVYQGGGVAFIRYIPFWAHGVVIESNQFRSRPSADRTGNFAGKASFYSQANNMGAAASGKGETLIESNVIVNGGGVSQLDECIFFNDFGNLTISSNNFDGHDGQATSVGAQGIVFTPGTSGGIGECALTVSNNTFGAWLHGPALFFQNGSNTSGAARQCRSLIVTDNVQRGGDFFVRMSGYSYSTYEGCPNTVITGNVIDGTLTSFYPPPSANNYGIAYAGNVTGDVGIIVNNIFINKTEPIISLAAFSSTNASLQRYGNSYYNITTPFNAANRFPVDRFEIPQIQFPATPVLSTNPNTLDDYEEGTFTPVFTPASGTFTSVTAANEGGYTKIGNTVYFWIVARTTGASNLGTASGTLYLTGLPFVCSSGGGYGQVSVFQLLNLGTAFTNLGVIVEGSTSRLYLSKNSSNSGVGYVQATELSTAAGSFNNLLGIFGQYQV